MVGNMRQNYKKFFKRKKKLPNFVFVMDYKTLAADSTSVSKEKMSKFIAFARPVTSAAEAREFIDSVARKYHDARHVCWAYMIGAARTEFLSSDNGEPSGTAGKPILGQINSLGLTDVAIAVVRYFGGIKLGTSGLIQAYREAARSALDAGEIITLSEMSTVSFNFPYLAMNDVMRLVKTLELKIVSQTFDNTCSMTISCTLDDRPAILARLGDIDGCTVCDE